MSLQTLRELRIAGNKPATVLKLVVGVPSQFPEWEDVIAVTEAPERMDWRPVVGLPLAVFVADGAVDLGERAFACALKAGCHPVGVAFSDGAHSLDEETKAPMRRMWELLCRS